MDSNFTNRRFFVFYVFVFVLSVFIHSGRSLEETHPLMKFPWTQESSAPGTGLKLPEPQPPYLLLPPPYLQLPMFIESLLPRLDPVHFQPVEGTGGHPLPENMQELLRPTTTEPPPTEAPPENSVRMDCKDDLMIVEVNRTVLGSSDPEKTLRLGTCSPTKITQHYVHFEQKLWKCGTDYAKEDEQFVFNNTLHFNPEETQSPIRRTAPFSLELECYFKRFQYSYKMGYVPTNVVQKLYKRIGNNKKFTLTPTNAKWKPLSPSEAFTLGKPMFFEAQTEVLSSGQRLYLHSCFATPEQSTSSKPRFNVVGKYGCMEESKDGHSSFFPSANNAVRFSVDAFTFVGFHGNTLSMHCTMSVGPYLPTDTDKSCNYHTDVRRWVELNGSDTVCSCCESSCGSSDSEETVISSKPWNVDMTPTSEPQEPHKTHKPQRPHKPPTRKGFKMSGTKRKSKSPPRELRPKHIDTVEKVTQPREKVTQPREKVTQPREKVTQPREKVTQPEEMPVWPEEKVVHPRKKVIQPKEKPVWPEEEKKPVWPEEEKKPVWPEEEQKPVWPEEEKKPVWPEEKVVHPRKKVTQPKEKPVWPEEKGESAEKELISETVRWTMAKGGSLEVPGSAVVEEVVEVKDVKEEKKGKKDKEMENKKKRKFLVFEDVFGLD